MPFKHKKTLTQFLIEERRRYPDASGDFNALILDISLACKAIAKTVAFGELEKTAVEIDLNVHGETQKKLDVLSNRIFVQMNQWAGHLAGMASEEMDDPLDTPSE